MMVAAVFMVFYEISTMALFVIKQSDVSESTLEIDEPKN